MSAENSSPENKFCIDGRSASNEPSALLAQEVIHQLLKEAANPEAVLLTHPKQTFSKELTAGIERRDTKRRVGRSPLYWFWEKSFIRNAGIGAFHRFRPVDRLNPPLSCKTLTTLLPPRASLPFFISRRANHSYVVPSQRDAKLLTKQYHIEADQIFTVQPAARSFIHEAKISSKNEEGSVLFLVGETAQRKSAQRLKEVFAQRYPHLEQSFLSLKNQTSFAPVPWVKLAQKTRVCVYLTELPFDWPTLALETLFWEIPTLFLDRHHSLNELLPKSSLRLSSFLVSLPELSELTQETKLTRTLLEEAGVFDPGSLARQYRKFCPVAPDQCL